MKDELTNEAYEALSKYRQARAHETLEEIPFLREKGYYSTATNRLYYACYYAALSLLAKHHITAGTHAGVKSMIIKYMLDNNSLDVKGAKVRIDYINGSAPIDPNAEIKVE